MNQSNLTASKDQPKKPVNARRLLASVGNTVYPVVKSVLKNAFKCRLTLEDEADCDLFWWDLGVPADKLARMKPYQKINHFPGMSEVTRKNLLGRNLNRMRSRFPADYSFYPKTWMLPGDWTDFASQFTKKRNRTFIIKPEASSQGRGIFLTRSLEEVPRDSHLVAQRYLYRPYLIDGLKFDLRLYVLVVGCDPLRVYLHREGLARFATEPYIGPQAGNLGESCMHLTNYSINKANPNFILNDDADIPDKGHKRSLTSTLQLLGSQGHDTDQLWSSIEEIVIKTLVTAQPTAAHLYRTCQPDDYTNSMCFEILGFDIILDHRLKPHLLEVNHAPSFSVDSPLDLAVKKTVIEEALSLVNMSVQLRRKLGRPKQPEMLSKALNVRVQEKKQFREKRAGKFLAKREAYEAEHSGGYMRILPGSNDEYYQRFLEVALNAFKSTKSCIGPQSRSVESVKPLTVSRSLSTLAKKPIINKAPSMQSMPPSTTQHTSGLLCRTLKPSLLSHKPSSQFSITTTAPQPAEVASIYLALGRKVNKSVCLQPETLSAKSIHPTSMTLYVLDDGNPRSTIASKGRHRANVPSSGGFKYRFDELSRARADVSTLGLSKQFDGQSIFEVSSCKQSRFKLKRPNYLRRHVLFNALA
jgi:tubulin polyglutamylase TTLL6/13